MPGETIGNWELRNELCGWSGPKTYASGNGIHISIYSNGRFESTFAGVYSGTYTITQRLNPNQQLQWYIYFFGNWKHEYRLDITNGKLSLDNGDYIADGCGYTFERY